MASNAKVGPFAIKNCALSAIATGRRAQTLRDRLLTVHPGSIYYHFWVGCCDRVSTMRRQPCVT